ncbi:hypothetical protein McanMca71_007562 [Microsporum canis]|uniref:Zn(2)-C6 fungal-type domain-containing protein n=1 Tax=Arthroderma otae (strain ATCC MYA-4605 / CBS 113480) TaxID=554155 RepID=C5G0P3_ARTOC|nr:conserved hypothetical protein [Microsporum canis CBS 113480]EEQ35696.1 conserved hypothetical protein [Microsporum canis CBS 113480]
MTAEPPSAFNWLDQALPLVQEDSLPSSKPAEAPKRHAACDECRKRKLKCTGDVNGCRRCTRHGLYCHYSFQKQMGRPPKTARSLVGLNNRTGSRSLGSAENPDLAYGTPDALGALEASNMCPAIYKTFMKNTYDVRPGPFISDGPLSGSNDSLQQAAPETSTMIPRDIDYSQISSLLSPSQTSLESSPNTSTASPAPSAFPQVLAPCSCLSHLYLSLSSLATLSSFPLSPNTLITLYNASKTASGVLSCQICPQTYSSAVQNLMLLGTLLTCIANSWYEISLMDAEPLATETLGQSTISSLQTDSEAWKSFLKDWLYQIVRYAVIGHPTPPNAPYVQNQCEESPNLLSLVEGMEARQMQWHAARLPLVNPSCPREHAESSSTAGQKESDYFCVRVAGNARQIIDRFPFSADELQNRK